MRWETPLYTELNRFFDAAFNQTTARGWVPAMDLVEASDHYVLRADLPGMTQKDLTIEFHDSTLTLSGERARDPREGHDGFFRLERPTGKFSRTLTLPKGVDVDAISASFENGVLEISIPKPAEAKPRRIEIGERQEVLEA